MDIHGVTEKSFDKSSIGFKDEAMSINNERWFTEIPEKKKIVV